MNKGICALSWLLVYNLYHNARPEEHQVTSELLVIHAVLPSIQSRLVGQLVAVVL